jgi:hypothetical protein
MLYKSFYGHKEFHNAKSWEAYTIELVFVIYGKWAVCSKLLSFIIVHFHLYFTHL